MGEQTEGRPVPAPVPSADTERQELRAIVTNALTAHRIECTGRGEVSCRGCRETGWMSWGEYHDHLADAVLDALGLEECGRAFVGPAGQFLGGAYTTVALVDREPVFRLSASLRVNGDTQ